MNFDSTISPSLHPVLVNARSFPKYRSFISVRHQAHPTLHSFTATTGRLARFSRSMEDRIPIGANLKAAIQTQK
jgi:hypothetical protein